MTTTTRSREGVSLARPPQHTDVVGPVGAGATTEASAVAGDVRAGAGPRLLHGLLGIVLLGYWISLIVRPVGQSSTWLDGGYRASSC